MRSLYIALAFATVGVVCSVAAFVLKMYLIFSQL
ncbi:hypothetical protein [Salmonella phage vB_SenS_SB10]|uniref:Uncharacterized protein n=1 Tax=Salmonella phage vB_SenS_SB10 TaxID=2591134 RepID=A0A5J6TB41_9CAUD|nr:hypothetical protein [Salmonella phage vB_SenS_SB10]